MKAVICSMLCKQSHWMRHAATSISIPTWPQYVSSCFFDFLPVVAAVPQSKARDARCSWLDEADHISASNRYELVPTVGMNVNGWQFHDNGCVDMYQCWPCPCVFRSFIWNFEVKTAGGSAHSMAQLPYLHCQRLSLWFLSMCMQRATKGFKRNRKGLPSLKLAV